LGHEVCISSRGIVALCDADSCCQGLFLSRLLSLLPLKMSTNTTLQEKLSCYHCGEDCPEHPYELEDKKFCCEGCRTVFDILNKSGMCEYYDYNNSPGQQQSQKNYANYDFLNDEQVSGKFITFRDEQQIHASFYVPGMHCSSCIWLLENLNRIHPKIILSRVNFIKKEVSVVFSSEMQLSDIGKLLDRVGYPPHLSLSSLDDRKNEENYFDKTYFYKLGVAFFAFGNIMLLSFPEYFGIDGFDAPAYRKVFGYLNLALSLPVMFYSAGEFFKSAWNGLKMLMGNPKRNRRGLYGHSCFIGLFNAGRTCPAEHDLRTIVIRPRLQKLFSCFCYFD
jgi:hypothetical protein